MAISIVNTNDPPYSASEGMQASDCSGLIYEHSRYRLDPDLAEKLWPKVLQHKWFLSEKLDRDVGLNVACLDLLENLERMGDRETQDRIRIIRELGGHMVDRSLWETISDSQPPKQIVNKRIILPLTMADLAQKHGVRPPRAIMFFGPPGTGKTHFVRAIAGVLQWFYVEISPSKLMEEGEDRLGANLKKLMDQIRGLDEIVVFIDEFEEIAGNRDNASRVDKSITNEFLKQVQQLQNANRKNLLVCATNYVHQLDSALLRPGRFDCIIPVGGPDELTRRIVFEYHLSQTNQGEVDVDRIVAMTEMFSPADLEYLFQRVTQEAFEQEHAQGKDFRVTTEDFLEMIPRMRPTLTKKIVDLFDRDCERYTRY
jgi:transitional endoplasmic reticulum ATPase